VQQVNRLFLLISRQPRPLVGHEAYALSSRQHELQACLVDGSYAGRLVWSAVHVQCTIILSIFTESRLTLCACLMGKFKGD